MPCEQCHVQFTVFKRKKSCSDCKRYYCHSCLVNTRKHSLLCDRCLLFSRRPLQRSDLVQLKTKDLIFYLQSKHISTAGCVEKEDLIDLVMRMDSNQNPSSSSGSSSKSSSKSTTPQHQQSASEGNGNAGTGGNTNSFDNIKQTCQNFFSSLSENISDSFANLESRACSKSRGDRQNRGAANVTEQPRVATREIPTYASRQQRTASVEVVSPTESTETRTPTTNSNPLPPPQPTERQESPSSPQSPTSTRPSPLTEEQEPKEEESKPSTRIIYEGDCECSDEEELIATFSTRTRSPKIAIEPSISNDETDQTNPGAPSTSASTSKPSSQYSKLEIYINEEEESSHSSFEELGAIGGISDDSKTTTDTTSNTTDQWQILDLKQDGSSNQTMETPDGNGSTTNQQSVDETSPKPQTSAAPPPPPPLRLKKVIRRRSESYLNRRRPQISLEEDDDDEDGTILSVSIPNPTSRIEEETQTSSTTSNTTAKRCCLRCGKNKANIRHQVEKLRKHLESSQMSESDIKQELREFLAYLEQRTKSVEYSDSEAGTSTPSATGLTDNQMATQREFNVSGTSAAFNYFSESDVATNQYEKGSRFINLEDYDSFKQLEGLSVKQLKEVLMLHRVDYKGCCEKQELLDRVGRLWKNLKSTPAVDKLPTDELCKICMDAPIECVILECGHMATCTNCGKVLSECPICRQYIVRVVRFFRA